MVRAREYTNRLYQMMDDGLISYQAVAEMALAYMSETEVHDMMEKNELLIEEDEDDHELISYYDE